MIIYKDVCTGDELFSDAYKIAVKDEDFLITVVAKMTTMKGESVSADLIGGNPSAEGGDDEGVEDAQAKSGLDIVMAQSLEDQSGFFGSKKILQSYLKKFVKNVVAKLTEDEEKAKCDKFKKECTSKLKSFLELFNDSEDTIFCGPKFDPEEAQSCPMIGKWDEDGMGLTFYMIKSALYEEKQ